MSHQTPHSWKDLTDSRVVESFAIRSGCDVRQAHGSHKVITYKNRSETFYKGSISTGVACKLWKFFVRAGLIVVRAGLIAAVFVAAISLFL